jgi:choline dehydrogenase-like flavoprotein
VGGPDDLVVAPPLPVELLGPPPAPAPNAPGPNAQAPDTPGPDVLTDDGLLDRWIAAHLSTAQHTCGTVPIGPAVDQYGRVHGLRGLRVADTSILPDVPARGPAATAVLIGELIAEAIRAGTRSAPGT